MAVTKLELLNKVYERLQEITTGNGYRTTVATVERTVKVWSEVGGVAAAASLPWVGFGMPDVVPNPLLPGGVVHCEGKLSVAAHVAAATPSACSTALCNLEDDIIGALCTADAAGYLDGYAIDVIWVRTQDDIADPTAVDHRGGYGSMMCDFLVRWDRTLQVTP